jgi:hypothetical protein
MKKIFILLFIFLTGCNNGNLTIGRKAITNLSKSYTFPGIFDNVEQYRYSKSIVNKYNTQIQLWENDSDIKKVQEILVYIHDTKYYAIPILSNGYKRFWNFQFDFNQTDTSNVSSTFEKEFDYMLQELNLQDSVKIANQLLFDTFIGILELRKLHDSDSTDLLLAIDNRDYNYSRLDTLKRQNEHLMLIDIYKNIHTRENTCSICYNAFWDEINGRLFQINYDSLMFSKKFNPSLKIYRVGRKEIYLKI